MLKRWRPLMRRQRMDYYVSMASAAVNIDRIDAFSFFSSVVILPNKVRLFVTYQL